MLVCFVVAIFYVICNIIKTNQNIRNVCVFDWVDEVRKNLRKEI